MVFCSSCGSELADGWVACPNCGAAAGEQSTLVGTPNPQIIQPQTIVVNKGNITDSGDIIVGIICLIIAAISFSSYSNSICGTVLSPLAGDDCSMWNAFNLICGGFGILAILLGLRGKPEE